MSHPLPEKPDIAIIGLGYVGLPLALEFARQSRVIGFDINKRRIAELLAGRDSTREVDDRELTAVKTLEYVSDPEAMRNANVYIVTVPTPIDQHKRPDLRPLIRASQTVGRMLEPGNVVIYESTVYPGCTEEECVPRLERESGLTCCFDSDNTVNLKHNDGFFVGYSPERINPGDRKHRLPDIKKVTSGSTPDAANFIDNLYANIITAGTHKAPSIKIAEAAKIIENTQRDVNIGLVNELAMLFGKLGLDTGAVLDAASTKWNFLPFQPGLVGGHCIGVDPYYLTHKAQQIGFHPQMILAGRRTNDGMGSYVAGELVKLMAKKSVYHPGARVLVLGLTFKENCPDLRNTRVVDLIVALTDYNLEVDVYDPWADPSEAKKQYGLKLATKPDIGVYHAITIAVGHEEFKAMANTGIRSWGTEDAVVYDLKHILPAGTADGRL